MTDSNHPTEPTASTRGRFIAFEGGEACGIKNILASQGFAATAEIGAKDRAGGTAHAAHHGHADG